MAPKHWEVGGGKGLKHIILPFERWKVRCFRDGPPLGVEGGAGSFPGCSPACTFSLSPLDRPRAVMLSFPSAPGAEGDPLGASLPLLCSLFYSDTKEPLLCLILCSEAHISFP